MNMPDDMETSVEKVLADKYKRKRIREYAMAALPGVIQTMQSYDARDIARRALHIAETMEYEEHVRNR